MPQAVTVSPEVSSEVFVSPLGPSDGNLDLRRYVQLLADVESATSAAFERHDACIMQDAAGALSRVQALRARFS